MMTNLFLIFDPSINMNLTLNWLSSFLILLMIPSMFWLIPSRTNIMWMKINSTMNSELKMLMKTTKEKNMTIIFMSLFLVILMNNLLSIFPYIFPSTSHLMFTLSLALPMWISFMIYAIINNLMKFLSHMTPQGTIPVLMPLMVMIETISNIIRPGTLSIRLMTNITAGHLIMMLIGSMEEKSSIMMMSMIMIIQLMITLLELMVALIQAYVFSVLSTMYSSEVY